MQQQTKRLIVLILLVFTSQLIQAQLKQAVDSGTLVPANNTTAAKTVAENFKVTHGPYLQNLDQASVTLVWITNRKGIAWVELAPADSTNFYKVERKKYFSASNGLKTVSTIHKVNIGNLQPGTVYRYRIFSQEVVSHKGIDVRYGEVVATRVFQRTAPQFRTNDHQKRDISFLMLNDIHERNEVMKSLVKGTDWKNTDMVFFAGDMVNTSRSEDQLFTSFMDTAVQLFASEVPLYYARGNHETRGEFADAFAEYFPGPGGKLYYMFRQGPVCFLILDSGEDKPDSDIEYGGITAFDAYRDEQAAWLKEAIRSKLFTEAPFKVAIAHIPPLEGWHGEQELIEKFLPLLNEGKIDLMLCGHLHRNVHREARPGVVNFPIMVNSNNSMLKVTADGRQMKINLIDLKGTVVDTMVINKK